MCATPAIKVTDVSFSYGKRVVLNDISLEIPKGTFAALLGPNGVGKSTLLKTISGYLKPDKGKVLVCNQLVHFLEDKQRSRLAAYLAPDTRSAYEFTVEEVVMMGRLSYSDSILSVSASDVKKSESAMIATQIMELRHRSITSLSSGEQQRVQIARIICQDPKVFLLDEPTSHLDIKYELEIMGLVKELTSEGRTVLAVFHDVNLALRYASLLIFMKAGNIVHLAKSNQLNFDIIKEVYEVKSRFLKDDASSIRFIVPYSDNKY